MTRGLSRASVLAVVREDTEGTLKQPTSATDYLALQPDTSLAPNVESLQNDEQRNSIGIAQPVNGLEAPTGSLSHYFRHSGVEGTAPNFGKLLEAVMGVVAANGTQRLTTTSSTVSLLKLASGGTDFARGKAVLVKDSTNGYSIRPVDSVSTNDLTLGFNLANAPATGIGVGKCINYAPANSGHPSFSVIRYNGSGHSIDAISGARVTEMSLDANAGEFLNASYSLAGTKYFYNPIVIAAADVKLDFDEGGSALAATIVAGTYRTPHELAAAVKAAMNSVGADLKNVVYNDTGAKAGKFTISTNGTTFNLLWSTGTNAANSINNRMGYSGASDDTGATTYDSDTVLAWASPYSPSYDSAQPLVGKANEVLIGDATDNVNFCANSITIQVSNTNQAIECIGAETGVDGNFFSQREVTISITGLVDQHDADLFERYRSNSSLKFCYNFGEKAGGNWIAGKSGCIYSPSCTVSSFEQKDANGLVGIDVELKCFVDSSGNGEFYINFL